jgi:chromosome partitioning protein
MAATQPEAVQAQLADLPPFDPPGWRVITVIMQKGGVGKTATSGGLAVQLSEAGVPVVMIDLCHTGALTESFGLDHIEDDANIATLMTGKWDGSIYDLAVPVRRNLWLIPAAVDTVVLAEDLQTLRYREERLRGALDDEQGTLPERAVVIIDCPPTLSLVTDNAILACGSERGGAAQHGGLLLTPELLTASLKTLTLLMQQARALEGGGRFTVNALGWFASATDNTKASKRAQEALAELPYERLGEMPRRTNIKDARDAGLPLLDAFPKLDANDIHRELAQTVRGKLHV